MKKLFQNPVALRRTGSAPACFEAGLWEPVFVVGTMVYWWAAVQRKVPVGHCFLCSVQGTLFAGWLPLAGCCTALLAAAE